MDTQRRDLEAETRTAPQDRVLAMVLSAERPGTRAAAQKHKSRIIGEQP